MKCSFCDAEIEKGTGKLFVEKSGRTLAFCSRKCEKNMLKLKRDPRDFKWTGKHEKK